MMLLKCSAPFGQLKLAISTLAQKETSKKGSRHGLIQMLFWNFNLHTSLHMELVDLVVSDFTFGEHNLSVAKGFCS